MLTTNWPNDICIWAGSASGSCSNYWTAWSTVATGLAVAVALLLPFIMMRKEWGRRDQERREEWSRQDRLREDEQAEKRAARKSVIQEVCSAADQILAYREAAIALAKAGPPYNEPMRSLERMSANTSTLNGMLDILKMRPELTDGAAYCAVAAQSIAAIVIEQTKPPFGQTMNDWPNRVAALEEIAIQAGLLGQRVTGVRNYFELGPSTSAARINAKYGPMAAELEAAAAEQRAPIFGPLAVDHY